MAKNSGGFQGFMLKYFEKIALGVFGVLVVLFLVFAVLGTYYDRDASELTAMVDQKASAVRDATPAGFEGLRGVEVTNYSDVLNGVDASGTPTEVDPDKRIVIIDTPVPPRNKRVMPEILPPTEVTAFGSREVLAINGNVGGDERSGSSPSGAGSGRATGSSGAGGGSSTSVQAPGEGGSDGGGDAGGDAGGDLGGSLGSGGNSPAAGDAPKAGPAPTGYQPPPGDSQTRVESFITIVGRVPHAAQDKEFIAKTRNTLGPDLTRPQYIAAQFQRRARNEENWETMDVPTVKSILQDVRQWVSSNVEEVVEDRYLYPMGTDFTDPQSQYWGTTANLPPAIGRTWGANMTVPSIPTIEAGPVYRPLDDVFGEWRGQRRGHFSFLANQAAYDAQENIKAIVDSREKVVLSTGEDADQVVLSVPDNEEFADQVFTILDDGNGQGGLLNPKVAELRQLSDVVLEHTTESWYELYRKTDDGSLHRIVVMFLDGKDMATEAVVFEQTFEPYRQESGFGTPKANQSAAGQQPAAQSQAPQGPSDYLLRFYDTTVEKGREYQYRIRYVLQNPNYQLAGGYLEDPSTAEEQYVFSDWSEPTDWVSVAAFADTLTGPALPEIAGRDAKIKMMLREPSSEETPLLRDTAVAMLLAEVEAERGQLLNFAVENPIAIDVILGAPAALDLKELPNGRKEGFKHRYRTDELVLDIRGGKTYTGGLTVPGEVLVMDASGNLVVKSEMDSGYAPASNQYEIGVTQNRQRPDDEGEDDGRGSGGGDGFGGGE